MKIGVVGSMQHTEKMLAIVKQLEVLGHIVFTSRFASTHVGKSDLEKEQLKLYQKYNEDAIRQDCKWIKNIDALLVANYDKHDIKNYIGGNAFLEMGYAHILGKQLYLMHPIPKMPYYETEIIAMKPTIISGDLSKIK